MHNANLDRTSNSCILIPIITSMTEVTYSCLNCHDNMPLMSYL